MPRIPPPILSLLKIQLTHLILDGEKDLATKLALAALAIEYGPKIIEYVSEEIIDGDEKKEESGEKEKSEKPSMKERIKKAFNGASNKAKIRLVEYSIRPFAKMSDDMNVMVYEMVTKDGFQKIKVENPKDPLKNDMNEYWFNEYDRKIKKVEDVKFFEKVIQNSITQGREIYVDPNTFLYNGPLEDDEKVEKYCTYMLDVVLSGILFQIYDFVRRLIIKIRIFISELYKAISLIMRAKKTGIQVGKDTADSVSGTFQTVASVGVGSSVSIITV